MTERRPNESLEAHVRRVDEDRWLASRFAPPAARRALTALYAFQHEIARVAEAVSDPMIGEIRLAWWREAAEEALARPAAARKHDVVQALAADLAPAPGRPGLDALIALIDARVRDLEPEPFETTAELTAHVDATAGALAEVAAGVALGAAPDAETARAARAAGRAWGLVGHVRAAPAVLARGRTPLSLELIRAAGFGDATLSTLADADALRRLADVVAPLADAALAEARAAAPNAAAWPGYGYAALAPGYARRIGRAGGDADPGARPRLARQAALLLAAARGRV